MAHTYVKRFEADIAYTERDFQVGHLALGNQSNFEYERRDLNKQLLIIKNGNALLGGYFYEIEGEVTLTMPHETGIVYVAVGVNSSAGTIGFKVVERIKELDSSLGTQWSVAFAVHIENGNIFDVMRTTQDQLIELFDQYKAKDFVIESGTNNEGVYYEKWNLGKLKMWGQADLTPIKDQAVSVDIQYPINFSQNNYVSHVTARTAGPNDVQVSVANNVRFLKIYLQRNSTIRTGVNWSAEGTWK